MPVSEKTLHILSGITSSLSASAPLDAAAAIQKRRGSIKAQPQLYSAIPAQYRREMERARAATTTTATSILPNGRQLVVHIISYSSKSEVAAMWPLIHRWFGFAFAQTPDRRCTAAGMEVFIYLTGYKKRVQTQRRSSSIKTRRRSRISPLSYPILDYRHVNTAVTTSCPHTMQNNTIVVFRKEEWLRALIHETIHFMGWDFSGDEEAAAQANRAILGDMWRGLPPDHDLRVYESFCDTWATILQVLLLNNRKNTKNTIVSLLDKERRHSLRQCRKVMAHLGLTWSDLETPGSSAAAAYREKTPILAYYVLKSACMYFIDDFVGLFSEATTPPFQFPAGAVRRYSGFLIQGLRDPGFRRMVDTTTSTGNGDSMRMSITGS